MVCEFCGFSAQRFSANLVRMYNDSGMREAIKENFESSVEMDGESLVAVFMELIVFFIWWRNEPNQDVMKKIQELTLVFSAGE